MAKLVLRDSIFGHTFKFCTPPEKLKYTLDGKQLQVVHFIICFSKTVTNKPFMTTGTSFNSLTEETDCKKNFCGTYFCDSVTQKHCILRNKFLRIMSSFCMFSLKTVEFS